MNARMKTLRKFYSLLGRSGTVSEPFSYIVPDTSVTSAMTHEYLGNNVVVPIPNSIDGYTITELGPFTFLNHTNTVSVTIPDSVERID